MREAKICCYCGTRKATTRDHVPPKAIFNSPLPYDLITVPACFECNNTASINDERFTAFLGMHVGKEKGTADKLFQERTRPIIRHNRKLGNYLFSNMKRFFLASDSGNIEKVFGMLWDSEVHDSVIEKITRGLFYHHYKTIIGPNVKIRVHWYRRLPDFNLNMLHRKSIQDGAFTYYYNKAQDCDYDSIWVFQFYEAHWAGAIITS
jgi:hypothetical protein